MVTNHISPKVIKFIITETQSQVSLTNWSVHFEFTSGSKRTPRQSAAVSNTCQYDRVENTRFSTLLQGGSKMGFCCIWDNYPAAMVYQGSHPLTRPHRRHSASCLNMDCAFNFLLVDAVITMFVF